MMRVTTAILSASLLLALPMACTDSGDEERHEAAANAGVVDLSNAANRAMTAASGMEAAADRLGNQARDAIRDVRRKGERAADNATDETGAALENAGRDLRD